VTPLTPPLAACVAAIKRLTVNAVPPSLPELAEALGYRSASAVHRLLVELRDRGVVTWEPQRSRSLRLLAEAPSAEEIGRYSDCDLISLAHAVDAELLARGLTR
jgi:SOS-response transcriptional repressor LexA